MSHIYHRNIINASKLKVSVFSELWMNIFYSVSAENFENTLICFLVITLLCKGEHDNYPQIIELRTISPQARTIALQNNWLLAITLK